MAPIGNFVVLDPGQLLRNIPLQLEWDKLIVVALPQGNRALVIRERIVQLHRVELPVAKLHFKVSVEGFVVALLSNLVLQHKQDRFQIVQRIYRQIFLITVKFFVLLTWP